MAIDRRAAEPGKSLCALAKENELIIKPFHAGFLKRMNAAESGRIVSRFNRPLFDYQMGGSSRISKLCSIFSQRITLFIPGTKQIVLELRQNRLPRLLQTCCKQDIRCWTSTGAQGQSIGFIRQRLALGKVSYTVYNHKYDHDVSLILRKNHLRGKIQHRVLNFDVIDDNEQDTIGGIYPYSTHFEGTEYGLATAVKVPYKMKTETKATLLIAALILKSRLN